MTTEEKRVTPRRKSDTHSCDVKERVEQLQLEVDALANAFPDGPLKHREVHEAWVNAKKAEEEFYKTLKTEIMKKGVAGIFSLIAIILGLAMSGLLHEVLPK